MLPRFYDVHRLAKRNQQAARRGERIMGTPGIAI
jgi:hypothetical protein